MLNYKLTPERVIMLIIMTIGGVIYFVKGDYGTITPLRFVLSISLLLILVFIIIGKIRSYLNKTDNKKN